MELIRQIQLSTVDSQCFFRPSNNYHFNLRGSLADLPIGKFPLYIQLTNLSFPVIEREISLSLYYGPQVSYMSETDVRSVTIKYCSFEELCMRLMFEANCMLKSKNCTYTSTDHSSHICEGVDADYLLRLSYENMVFKLVNGPSSVCVLTCNFLRLIGFDEHILKTFRQHELEEIGINEALLSCSKPILISGRITVGRPIEYLDEKNKHCNVIIDGLISAIYFVNGCRYCVLGTYCMESKKLISCSGTGCFQRVVYPITDEISITLVNRSFEPYDFKNGNSLVPISFTINFFRPL